MKAPVKALFALFAASLLISTGAVRAEDQPPAPADTSALPDSLPAPENEGAAPAAPGNAAPADSAAAPSESAHHSKKEHAKKKAAKKEKHAKKKAAKKEKHAKKKAAKKASKKKHH